MTSVITDPKYREHVERATQGFNVFDVTRKPKIGERRVFVYGAYSEPSEYIAHRFHVVTIIKETEEYDYQGERMFDVQADDGWEGSAWASELFPLPWKQHGKL